MNYIFCEVDCSITPAAAGAWTGQMLNFQPAIGDNKNIFTVSFYIVFESNGLDRFSLSDVVATDAANGCAVPVACDSWLDLPAVHQLQAADVNGDGLADLVFRGKNNSWYYRLNRGNGFASGELIVTPPNETSSSLGNLADINGDGFPEFLYPAETGSNTGTWKVSINDLGAGFAAAEPSDIRFGNYQEGDFSLLLDFTGDGMTDNLWIDFRKGTVDSKTTGVFVAKNLVDGTGQAVNAVSEIFTGTGARTVINYELLANPSVYTVYRSGPQPEWGRVSLVLDLIAPMHDET